MLLRFGDKMFDEEQHTTVADYIFHLPYDFESLSENEIVKQILREYKESYDKGTIPDKKMFLYHPDNEVAKNVAIILEDKEAELSAAWRERFEIKTVYGDDAFKRDTISSTNYLIIRKIQKLIAENQQEMMEATDFEVQIRCLEMDKHLKQIMKELTETVGTVIFK